MNEAAEAFADVRHPPRYGACHRCSAKTVAGARVIVRVGAQGMDPTDARKNRSLGSQGRTFCPTCARHVFDACSELIENDRQPEESPSET